MTKAHINKGLVPLGSVLCPSSRLTICDWVATGDWSPKRYHVSHPPDRPGVSIQRAGNADGAVIDGLRPDVAYPVAGELTRGEGAKVHLCRLSITIRDGIATERVEVGAASLWYGRMVVVDAALEMHWDDDVSTDGLADVAFWGRHGTEVAAEVGAGPLTWPSERDGTFGWRDLPLAAAEQIARDLEAMRSQEKAFAVDLRPHTEQWHHLENLRHSRRRSIEIEQDGARLIMFDNDSGHHLCFIDAELDAAGQLLRVIVDLERDPFE
ncbi:MAG: hypothetical protein INR71_06920 [Terriglobus roseus]|nr:hypothetical protein [Terriglobus roseus]